jgi:hypothetical protein
MQGIPELGSWEPEKLHYDTQGQEKVRTRAANRREREREKER